MDIGKSIKWEIMHEVNGINQAILTPDINYPMWDLIWDSIRTPLTLIVEDMIVGATDK